MGRIYEKLSKKELAVAAYENAVKSGTDPDAVRLASESISTLTPKR